MQITFVTPSNNASILKENIFASSIFKNNKYPLIVQRGYSNISKAYNDAMNEIHSDITVFLHQDVYLPREWENDFLKSIEQMNSYRWGVLGVAGAKLVNNRIKYFGYLKDRGREWGSNEKLPYRVQTIDELLLVIRNDKKICFDENIPSQHFYGADICLQAQDLDMDCYVINAYCHHNSTNSNNMSRGFIAAKKYIRSKWHKKLPFATTCAKVR